MYVSSAYSLQEYRVTCEICLHGAWIPNTILAHVVRPTFETFQLSLYHREWTEWYTIPVINCRWVSQSVFQCMRVFLIQSESSTTFSLSGAKVLWHFCSRGEGGGKSFTSFSLPGTKVPRQFRSQERTAKVFCSRERNFLRAKVPVTKIYSVHVAEIVHAFAAAELYYFTNLYHLLIK